MLELDYEYLGFRGNVPLLLPGHGMLRVNETAKWRKQAYKQVAPRPADEHRDRS